MKFLFGKRPKDTKQDVNYSVSLMIAGKGFTTTLTGKDYETLVTQWQFAPNSTLKKSVVLDMRDDDGLPVVANIDLDRVDAIFRRDVL